MYIYGSHDLFNGLNFCLGDYVCWSAPVDDLGNWKYHGVIYKREQDPAAPRIRMTNGLAAPDMVVGDDGSKPTEHGPMWFEIDIKDMLTVVSGDELHYIGVKTGKEAKGTSYEEQPFGEASSMRKFGDTYYFIYSSLNSHNLCYETSKSPTEGFEYGGILVSCGDIGLPGVPDTQHARNSTGNTHGSLIEINGKYYIFYHRPSNRKQSSRQACAEEIRW